MALSAAQRETWLAEDNTRIVLMDLGYHDGVTKQTLFASSYPYIMPQGDPAWNDYAGDPQSNLIYDDIIFSVPNIVTRLDANSTVGSINLINADGEYDYLLQDVTIAGHSIKLYIGGENWPRDNYILILDGIVQSVSSNSPEKIVLSIRDQKEKLNIPIQEELYIKEGYWAELMDRVSALAIAPGILIEAGGGGISLLDTISGEILYESGGTVGEEGVLGGFVITGADPILDIREYTRELAVLPDTVENTHVPICLGRCFNIEPVLVDSYNHVYQIHDSPEGIVDVHEVRANGIALAPEQYKYDTSIGLLRLLDHPNDTLITCDVTGQNGPSESKLFGTPDLVPRSAADIIEWILLEKANTTNTDICYDTFNPDTGFDNTVQLGFYNKTESNILSEITKIINSVGGFLRFRDNDCKIQLYRLKDPSTAEVINLYLEPDDIVYNGISINSVEEPKKSITLGYKKNFTPQTQLGTSITDDSSIYYDLDLYNSFKDDYSTLYNVTSISPIEYPLAEEISLVETTIYDKFDAENELTRRINLRKQRRRVVKLVTTARSFTYDIGDIVHLTHPRFGFTGGRKAMIIGIVEDPIGKRVTLDVWL